MFDGLTTVAIIMPIMHLKKAIYTIYTYILYAYLIEKHIEIYSYIY